MADIRIKDLTSPASSTASDDFIAVDGTTNGTRKLNAFSPTFGGNATVTGTLTGNSTITGANLISSVNSGAANGSEFTAFSALVGTDASLGPCRINIGALPSATFGSRYGYIACYDSGDYRKLYLGGSPGIAATGGQILIPATIASTTTSTGALVVSGGVGIAKQIVAGEDITIDPIDASPENLAPEVAFCRSASLATATSVLAFGSSSRIGLLRGYHDGADQVEWRFGSYIGSTFNEQMRLGGTSATSSSLTLYGTTASTSTASGALVVSGGVGVAGAGYFGGTVTIASNFSIASTGFYAGGGTPGAGRFLYSATAGTMLCAQTGSSYDLSLASATGTVILGNPTGTSNLEAAGSIKTAAPSGGTAAAWKLGTVATVSPTSPNRTIEVDIGGTIYYIHAKTTNN
jgi:hypothetical protein